MIRPILGGNQIDRQRIERIVENSEAAFTGLAIRENRPHDRIVIARVIRAEIVAQFMDENFELFNFGHFL